MGHIIWILIFWVVLLLYEVVELSRYQVIIAYLTLLFFRMYAFVPFFLFSFPFVFVFVTIIVCFGNFEG